MRKNKLTSGTEVPGDSRCHLVRPSMQRTKVPAGDSRFERLELRTRTGRMVPVLHAELDAERDVEAAGDLHDGEVLGGVGRHEAERAHAGLPRQRAELPEAEVPVRRRGQLQGRVQVRPVPEELEHAQLRRPVPAGQVRRQRGGHLRTALHAPPRRARREGQLGPPGLVGGRGRDGWRRCRERRRSLRVAGDSSRSPSAPGREEAMSCARS
jgi:hypothetical protein